MDAVKFIKERNRMCDCFKDGCTDSRTKCPLFEFDCNHLFDMGRQGVIEKVVCMVEKWSKEHPQKTILQDFLEKYPNAPFIDGTPEEICPRDIGYTNLKNCIFGVTCEECWSQPLEE